MPWDSSRKVFEIVGHRPHVFTLCQVLTSPHLPCLPPLYLHAAGDQRLEGMACEWLLLR